MLVASHFGRLDMHKIVYMKDIYNETHFVYFLSIFLRGGIIYFAKIGEDVNFIKIKSK